MVMFNYPLASLLAKIRTAHILATFAQGYMTTHESFELSVKIESISC